jgi:DNA-binding transcriptional MocR family regulator
MFHIQRDSSVPLSEQICREFADRIRTGILANGSRLPSVRELADMLDVSLVTVVQAYRLLEQRGLAKRIHGKGTFVHTTSQPGQGGNNATGTQAYDWQLAVVDYLPRAAVLGIHGRTTSADVPYKLSTASLDPALSSLLFPRDIGQVVQRAMPSLAEYGPVDGLEALRRDVVSYLREFGLTAHPDKILIVNGVQQAIDLAARAFLGPGDVVVVEAPTYPGAIDVFRSRGATIVSIPMDAEGIRLDLLTRQCDQNPPKLVYTMPTFHNPTGIVMSTRRRRQLLELAESCQFLILEDDSFSDCSFMGPPPPPIRSLDKHGHVIYVKGFSKVFAPGCRVAAVSSSGSIHTRLIAAKTVSDLGSPVITQMLVHACLTHPKRRQRVLDIAKAVQRKRDIALEVLSEQAPPGISWTSPQGGYNLWVTLPPHVNTDALLIEALHAGVSFLPGSACYVNENVRHQLRISYAWLDDDALREGVSRLCGVLRSALESTGDHHLPVL